jgi:sigma-B regulation protein RsbU (phosphoserine phosphatase)
LFLYTDGLTEALSSEGEPFEDDRLSAVLEEPAGKSLFDVKQAVLRAARSHAGGSLGQDDVTLMVVEVQ